MAPHAALLNPATSEEGSDDGSVPSPNRARLNMALVRAPARDPDRGMTAAERAQLVHVEQWLSSADLPRDKSYFKDTIAAPDGLNILEVRECYRILDHFFMAHGVKVRPGPDSLESFLSAIFAAWNSNMQASVHPLADPPHLGPLSRRSGAHVVVWKNHYCPSRRAPSPSPFQKDKGSHRGSQGYNRVTPMEKKLYVWAKLEPRKKIDVVLADVDGHSHSENLGTLIWEPRHVVDFELKDIMIKLLAKVDEHFQKYNRERAVQYARDFILSTVCSAGSLMAQRRADEGKYTFASPMAYVCAQYPMLWAAASDHLQPPQFTFQGRQLISGDGRV
ncbi:hypothetical protein XA68_11099 [Ophiocordyceps unilateralis]|uniref:Uncharacterized protein n=1 Tax=Ophiocordyceps unilateralis TaxID=268505 RepID=A0A2A9PHJ5_OPHUN|nr:hypothetical protein XA68_11099 [Ophiocordyceps unilateralis]